MERRKFTREFKLEAVRLIKDRGVSYVQASQDHKRGTSCRRTDERRDELAAVNHSITSSARASSIGGTVRPSALAVLRLITNSSLDGSSIGRSPGCAPLKIR